jgi:hypothetical protein
MSRCRRSRAGHPLAATRAAVAGLHQTIMVLTPVFISEVHAGGIGTSGRG